MVFLPRAKGYEGARNEGAAGGLWAEAIQTEKLTRVVRSERAGPEEAGIARRWAPVYSRLMWTVALVCSQTVLVAELTRE